MHCGLVNIFTALPVTEIGGHGVGAIEGE